MSEYKVPQDVEADDKLIGPFGFRQFLYLIAVALGIAMAWGLFQLFPPLVVIPLPVIVFFGALALPLRKDQPMEIYLAAMVSFYLKPRRRLWDPDGIDSLIEITAPKTVEVQRYKDISQGEARERFGYLAQIVDSQGWSVRGQGVQAPNAAVNSDVYFESQQVEDVLGADTSVAQSLDYMIGQSDAKRHQDMIDRMHQPVVDEPAIVPAPGAYNFFASQSAPAVAPTPVAQPTAYQPTDDPTAVFGPTIDPFAPIVPVVGAPVNTDNVALAAPAPTTSENVVSPGIMDLANNADLSIETIAREANRINQQDDMNQEVMISLR